MLRCVNRIGRDEVHSLNASWTILGINKVVKSKLGGRSDRLKAIMLDNSVELVEHICIRERCRGLPSWQRD